MNFGQSMYQNHQHDWRSQVAMAQRKDVAAQLLQAINKLIAVKGDGDGSMKDMARQYEQTKYDSCTSWAEYQQAIALKINDIQENILAIPQEQLQTNIMNSTLLQQFQHQQMHQQGLNLSALGMEGILHIMGNPQLISQLNPFQKNQISTMLAMQNNGMMQGMGPQNTGLNNMGSQNTGLNNMGSQNTGLNNMGSQNTGLNNMGSQINNLNNSMAQNQNANMNLMSQNNNLNSSNSMGLQNMNTVMGSQGNNLMNQNMMAMMGNQNQFLQQQQIQQLMNNMNNSGSSNNNSAFAQAALQAQLLQAQTQHLSTQVKTTQFMQPQTQPGSQRTNTCIYFLMQLQMRVSLRFKCNKFKPC